MTPKQKIYLVVGVPCSGKSWVCEQLGELYAYVRHDDFIGGNYVNEIIGEARQSTKPVLCETPFSMSQIMEPLQSAGFDVEPVFIIEDPKTLRERYQAREGKEIPKGHLTRQETYKYRAVELGASGGTSAEVLAYLRTAAGPLVIEWRWPWE